jgi:DNA helicase-2/ATP-dependent DNA helicase PcrA
MAWDDEVTGIHREIAESDAKRIGVLAGPGTGKTTYGLLRRVARLLETAACEPSDILLLTFTRTAAQDLVDKVAALGAPGVDEVYAGTIHGFCFGLLQKEAMLKTTGRVPRMLLEHEEGMMLRDLRGDFGDISEREERLRAFEAGWARKQSDHPGLASDPADRSFGAQVLEWLKHHRAMLIGEVVPLAYQYLRNNPRAEELSRFRHVIVDEYQDLNKLEQELIELLGKQASLCVAGDDDQSIYAFRYAHPEGIVLFANDPAAEAKVITTCGRCPEPVLKIANSLIEQAGDRSKEPLNCTQPAAGSVDVIQWDGLPDEIEGLAAAIAYDVASETREPGDFLVLVNRREVGYRIRAALEESDVRARSFFQDDALKRSPEAAAGFALLRLLVRPDDRVSLRVWLGLGDSKARADAYTRVREAAMTSDMTEREFLERVLSGEEKLSVRAIVAAYGHLVSRLKDLGAAAPDELVEELFPGNNIDVQLMRELAYAALDETPELDEIFERMLRALTQPEVPQSPDYVRVMSLHKSKGLTSPVVFIATAVDHVIPTIKAKLSNGDKKRAYEEGRRLFYVALTRCSNELVVSGPYKMLLGNALGMGVLPGKIWREGPDKVKVTRVIATPYLTELGPDLPDPIAGEDWLRARAGEG